jgi:hypothetical protein
MGNDMHSGRFRVDQGHELYCPIQSRGELPIKIQQVSKARLRAVHRVGEELDGGEDRGATSEQESWLWSIDLLGGRQNCMSIWANAGARSAG